MRAAALTALTLLAALAPPAPAASAVLGCDPPARVRLPQLAAAPDAPAQGASAAAASAPAASVAVAPVPSAVAPAVAPAAAPAASAETAGAASPPGRSEEAWARLFDGDIDRGEYEGVRQLSFELLERFSPRRYAYVASGRSLTAVEAFLLNLGEERVHNVPMTGAGAIAARVAVDRKYREPGETGLGPTERVLDEHHERFLSEPLARLEGRGLLLMDFVVNGRARHAFDFLNAYLTRAHPEVRAELAVFADDVARIGKDWISDDHVLSLSRVPWEALRRLKISHYDARARYGPWTPSIFSSDPYREPSANPAFEAYRARWKALMDADPVVAARRGRGP